MAPGRQNYDPASPIQIVNGLVTTERSGLGMWGEQSQKGFAEFCQWMRGILPKPSIITEIGCYAGESTLAFSMIADKVIAIDPWINGYDPDDMSSEAIPMREVFTSFQQRTAQCTNITVCKMTSKDAIVGYPDNFFDLVYIDATHKIGAVRDDIIRWTTKVKSGGHIAGHDFCGYWGEVVDAVLEIIGLPDVRFKDGSWAKRIVR